MQEVVLHTRSHHQGSEKRRQQQQSMKPIALLRRIHQEDLYRTVKVSSGSQWRSGIRHQFFREIFRCSWGTRLSALAFLLSSGGLPMHKRGSGQSAHHQSIDCNSLPGLKRTALPGGMETSAPVRGLRPIPVLRGRTLNTPNPRSSIRSPLESDRFMLSNTVSTAISAFVLVMPVRLTTSLI